MGSKNIYSLIDPENVIKRQFIILGKLIFTVLNLLLYSIFIKKI